MSAMPPRVRRRFARYSAAPVAQALDSMRPGRWTWHDVWTEDLGPDPDGARFAEISARMLAGRYYPADAIEFFGRWQEEDRQIATGDRILQKARVLPPLRWPFVWAMTEVTVAERSEARCEIGYATTTRHFARGVWQASLSRSEGRLSLRIEATVTPASFLYWLGLPWARHIQFRAWRRAVEEFRKI
jgi:hypothetical protein